MNGKMRIIAVALLMCLGLVICAALAPAEPLFKGGEVVPSGATVLFDGKDLSDWIYQATPHKPAEWKVENGYMEVRGGNICTTSLFQNYQLHLEFYLPLMSDAKGQARANSGVYMHGRYEVQVLDSYGLKSQSNDCGAIYGVSAPLVNACKPPEQWQSYDVIFHAPLFEQEGNKSRNARMTVFQNGVLIQDNVEVPGPTTGAINSNESPLGSLMLQDHGCAVRYRNIWIRPL